MALGRFVKKTFKKVIRTGNKFLRKRYLKKNVKGKWYKRLNVRAIANDVMAIKRSLNSERKYKDALWINDNVACVDYNSAGYAMYEITSTTSSPIQGDGYNERIGRQIKMTGLHINYQFVQQSACTQAQVLRMEIWKVLGDFETVDSTLIGKIYEPSTLSGLVDMNSKRNTDYIRMFKRVGFKYVSIKSDNYSGISNYNNGEWNIRLEDKLNYVDDSNTVATGQLIMLVFCKTGNKNGATASTVTGNQFNAVNTGVQVHVFGRVWYSDT